MNRYLIIRLSSFGDIAQCLISADTILSHDPNAEIHFLTRHDFYDFVNTHKKINKVWSLDRKNGVLGLIQLIYNLSQIKFTHIYDAHSNIRSHIISFFLRLHYLAREQRWVRFIRRSKERLKRILLFKFNINQFPKPYRGMNSYATPLKKWFGLSALPDKVSLHFESQTKNSLLEKLNQKHSEPLNLNHVIVLAPSATWELKRWPVEHWTALTHHLKNTTFVILAGPEDSFCDDIANKSSAHVLNLRGELSWTESVLLISQARGLISGDTGLLHAADLIGQNAIGIIGPTAFGFTSRPSSLIAEVTLSCRPCTKDGRGKCHNKEYKKCLVDISPKYVADLTNSWHNDL